MSPDYEDLARLYERDAGRLLRYFQRRVQDPEQATDLMAETFTILLERLDQFRGGEEELSGWLFRVAMSVLREHERRGEVRRRGSERIARERRALSEEEYERIEDEASSERIRAAVRAGLERLPAEQQDALRLRVVEGLSYAVVARRLGIDETAARMRVSRGMRSLRGMLKREYEREEEF